MVDLNESAERKKPRDLGTRIEKPSILLVGTFLPAGVGSRAVGEELAERLRLRGYTVMTTSHRLSRPLRLLDMISGIWARRDRYQVAHIDLFSGPAFFWAEASGLALKILGKPYILTLRGGYLPDFARRWPRRVRGMLESARVVTAPSPYLIKEMSRYRKDIELIPNPLALADYPFRLRSVPKPRLVWLRALHEIYNPQMAIQVIAELRSQFPDITLTMIGPDKGDGSLQAAKGLSERLGLEKQIRFVGGVPKKDVPGWLDRGDVFLNTTHVDNTPVSVLEAMACGMCIASTDVGGIPYLLDHNRSALLVPPGDAGAMASAVARILMEPDLARRLSGSAREKAERCDWLHVLPQWEELFSSIAAGAASLVSESL